MSPDNLLSLVQALRERIGEHRSALSSNEMLTRYALVDPLLCELGWDTADPAIVIPEDTSGLGRGRPDYVLQNNGQSAMVIEAKKLGSGLQNGARQAIDYAMDANRQARYFAITDGQHWEIYDTNRPASDMQVVSFDIMAASSAEVCLKAMALWRPAVEHGSVIAAETPIIGLDAVKQTSAVTARVVEATVGPPTPAMSDVLTSSPQVKPAIAPTPIDRAGREWITLSELRERTHQRDEPPIEIQFPGKSPTTVEDWNDLIHKIVNWLVQEGSLKKDDCPIPVGPKQCVVNTESKHLFGQRFHQPEYVNGFYVENNFSTPHRARNACIIVEHVNLDPAQFRVRLR